MIMTDKRVLKRRRWHWQRWCAVEMISTALLFLAAAVQDAAAFTTTPTMPVCIESRRQYALLDDSFRVFRCKSLASSLMSSMEEEDEYDAIVIGSGISGLCAGNYLAKNGNRVLMVESHSIPGGYTTNFFRKGFRFEVSTHMLNGCDSEGSIGRILSDFGVYDQVEFVPLKHLLRWVDSSRGIDAKLPVGIDAYLDTLCDLYPHEEKGIREFHETYYPLAAWVTEYEKRKGLNKMLYAMQNLPIIGRLLSLRRKTASDIIDPLIKDPACRELLTVMTALFGLHYTELDAAIFIMGSLMFHASGAYYPIGGSGKISKVRARI